MIAKDNKKLSIEELLDRRLPPEKNFNSRKSKRDKLINALDTLSKYLRNTTIADNREIDKHLEQLINKQIRKVGIENLPNSMKSWEPFSGVQKVKIFTENLPNDIEGNKDLQIQKKTVETTLKNEGNKELENISRELGNAQKIVRQVRKEKKALKLVAKRPNKDEMVKIIDEHRKLNGIVNYSSIGRKLVRDPDTIKRWIQQFGLSEYALKAV